MPLPLENIVSDPVNRRGNDHKDQHGTYSYYTTSDGEPITDTAELEDVQYRIIELSEDQFTEHEPGTEAECPELDQFDEEELENFCIHREDDGHCTKLGQTCVLNG